MDIIIALGMAKEGFDWIWCEHALTVGYRSSLTEIIQIIGRATRDAPGKESATFTNLIAEPARPIGSQRGNDLSPQAEIPDKHVISPHDAAVGAPWCGELIRATSGSPAYMGGAVWPSGQITLRLGGDYHRT